MLPRFQRAFSLRRFSDQIFAIHLRLPLVVGSLVLPSVAAAIVIRHDIPDAAYLAKESDFPALFSIYRTKAWVTADEFASSAD